MEFKKLTDKEYENVMCIYKIENKVTGKVYIGSTINLRKRAKSHIRDLNNNKHVNKQLQNSWNVASNKENFEMSILEKVQDETFLPYAELYYIEKYKRIKGVYNTSDPLEEIKVLKNRTKEKREEREQKKLIKNIENSSDFAKFRVLMEDKFNYLFEPMLEKLKDNNKYISYEKVSNHIFKQTEDKYEPEFFDKLLMKYMKYTLKISVFRFQSESYLDETLKKFDIPNRELTILNRERAREISEFNRSIEIEKIK